MNIIQRSTTRELKYMISQEKGSVFGGQCAKELAARRRAVRRIIIKSLPNLAAGAFLAFVAGMCTYYVVQLSIDMLKNIH